MVAVVVVTVVLVTSVATRGALGVDPFGQSGVRDPQEPAATGVKPLAEILRQVGGKPAGGVQPDLVNHPAEINDAANGVGGTAEVRGGRVHVVEKGRAAARGGPRP